MNLILVTLGCFLMLGTVTFKAMDNNNNDDEKLRLSSVGTTLGNPDLSGAWWTRLMNVTDEANDLENSDSGTDVQKSSDAAEALFASNFSTIKGNERIAADMACILGHLDAIDSRINTIDSRINKIDRRFNGLNTQQKEIQNQLIPGSLAFRAGVNSYLEKVMSKVEKSLLAAVTDLLSSSPRVGMLQEELEKIAKKTTSARDKSKEAVMMSESACMKAAFACDNLALIQGQWKNVAIAAQQAQAHEELLSSFGKDIRHLCDAAQVDKNAQEQLADEFGERLNIIEKKQALILSMFEAMSARLGKDIGSTEYRDSGDKGQPTTSSDEL